MTRAGSLLAVIASAVLITGCASSPSAPGGTGGQASGGGGYYQNDGPPRDQDIDFDAIPEAVPRHEPQSKYGNPASYEALGETYYVLDSAAGFTQTGIASWYGRQFHGRRTSSGESYNMYRMTAAHKRLPIPSYVRVTNRDTGDHVIVRVNDRGPFHDGRIIDLSYVAARRLGIVANGSAPVRIETVTPESLRADRRRQRPQRRDAAHADRTKGFSPRRRPEKGDATSSSGSAARPVPVANRRGSPSARSDLYLQSGAFGERANARRMRARLEDAGFKRVAIVDPDDGTALYRVRVGPFENARSRTLTQRILADRGFAVRAVEH